MHNKIEIDVVLTKVELIRDIEHFWLLVDFHKNFVSFYYDAELNALKFENKKY